MTFQFLGTAAAEGIPALFCDCPICAEAERAGGRNLRGRSGAVVDGRILIDFPPDIYAYKLRFGLDLTGVEHIFITHSHIDHLDAQELCYYHSMYSNRRNAGSVLHIYGNQKVLDTVEKAFNFDMDHLPDCVSLHLIQAFQPVEVGEHTITPLLADHDNREECVFYLIQREGKSFLFANDTTRIPQKTYEFLAGKRMDVVSLDCTTGKYPCNHSHMGFPDNLAAQRILMEQGSADGDTLFLSHHFSHNGHVNYDGFAALAGDSGFQSTYDGMVIEL